MTQEEISAMLMASRKTMGDLIRKRIEMRIKAEQYAKNAVFNC